jgi:RHS repeat-associated protein
VRGALGQWRWRSCLPWLLCLGLCSVQVWGQEERTFPLNEGSVRLVDVSPEADVYLRSMRLNRALNVWNVEVTVSNKVARPMPGPLVLLVQSFTNTTGPEEPDGDSEGAPFFELTAYTLRGFLAPGEVTAPRTLTLGRSGSGSPAIETRVFAGMVQGSTALGVTRSLNAAGQPLPRTRMSVTGPAGTVEQTTDPGSGVASFGQGAGAHVLKFQAEGHLPVWRREDLVTGATTVLPNPRLTWRNGSTQVSPLGGAVQAEGEGGAGVAVEFEAGAVSGLASVALTPVTGQALPAFLPLGWSPMNAFWLETSVPFNAGVTASVIPWGPVRSTETATLVRWDERRLEWIVVQGVRGNGANAIRVPLEGAGAYALVVADAGATAPPLPREGEPLGGHEPETAIAILGLTARGSVTPPASSASLRPELVTGTATVELRHQTQRLPSGFLLRGEVTERYLLNDGSLRLTPQYEHYVVGYQRPGDEDPFTLHARFPMRPVLLFGPDALEEATVRVDVLPEQPFDGAVLDAGGGELSASGVRLVAGSGRLTGPSAVRLRRLDATVFEGLMEEGHSVLAAFEVILDTSTLVDPLTLQISEEPADRLFVLARVVSDVGTFGLQPVERLITDASGMLETLEPEEGERLSGLRDSGQYVLVEVRARQGLIGGVARNGSGEVQAGMPVRLAGLPWLSVTDSEGRFQLVGPTGSGELSVLDPRTGDTGFVSVVIVDVGQGVLQDVGTAPSGPRVARIQPADGAERVPRVGSVVVEFNEAVNPGTVVGAIELLKPDDALVPAALTLNLRGTVATLSPATELSANTEYRVRLAETITDPGGLVLEGQREFRFRTVPLSTRDPAAQLIIYQPGATNVPPEVLAQIPAYEPGEDPFAIVVRGTPGVADPEVPVILVNESTGETATVLSRVDGSFASVIAGTEEDFVSATFVNLNGTRVYVPVSRQEFDDGFVGLYPQGGILEAESDGGPVRVLIEPEAVEGRAKFRIQSLSIRDVLEVAQGTAPEGGKVLGGLKIEVGGAVGEGGSNVEIPIDPEAFEFPPDLAPEEAALALAVVREVDGVVVYQVVDKLRYEDGKAISNTFPFLGFFASMAGGLLADQLLSFNTTVLLFGGKPVVATGIVREERAEGAEPVPVGGAFVSANPVSVSLGLEGRFPPGMVYATSGRDGRYSLVLPVDVGSAAVPFSSVPGYTLLARHPRHSRPAATGLDFGSIGVGLFSSPYFEEDLVLPFETLINFGAGSPSIRVNASVSSIYPGLEEEATIRARAYSGFATPEITFSVQAVASSVAGVDVSPSDVTLGTADSTALGRGLVESTTTITATKSLQAIVKVEASASSGSTSVRDEKHLFINFGGEDQTVPDAVPAADVNDRTGPGVIAMQPSPGSVLPYGERIRIRFSEPVNRNSVFQQGSVVITPAPLLPPGIELSADRQTLEVIPGRFASTVTEATLTIGPPLEDLAGNKFDQVAGMEGEQVFELRFRLPAAATLSMSGVENGGGVVSSAGYAYALDRATAEMKVFDLKSLFDGQAGAVASVALPSFPRDMALLPDYGYQPSLTQAVRQGDLVAVVGGSVGSSSIDEQGNVFFSGQYLRVFDVSDPLNPKRVLGAQLTLRNTLVDRVIWRPPFLVYVEKGSDLNQVGVLDFQEMLIGFNATAAERASFPVDGFEGVQVNNDGDYVDFEEGEQLPLPRRDPGGLELYGKRFGLVVSDPGLIQDVDFDRSGVLAVVVTEGRIDAGTPGNPSGAERVPASFRMLMGQGSVLPEQLGRVSFGSGARPKRVFLLLNQELVIAGEPQVKSLALVTLGPDADGKNKLVVVDITDPEFPVRLEPGGFEIPPELGVPQSIFLRADGLLGLALTRDLLLLDPERIADIPPPADRAHPAILGMIPGGGSGNFTLDQKPTGLNFVNLGSRSEIVRTAPRMRFVNFATEDAVVDPAGLVDDKAKTERALSRMTESRSLTVSRVKAEGDVVSSLSPPSPAVHFHVIIDAPGAAGAELTVALEGLNEAGYPLKNKGRRFAPVRSLSSGAVNRIKQQPRPDTDAPILECKAYRLSSDKRSPWYDLYLSEPIVVVQEAVSFQRLEELQDELRRHVLWGGHFLRASLDPKDANNPVIGPFAAEVDELEGILRPTAFVLADTQPGTYIPGNNPPPSGAEMALPGTFGMVNALNGEIRHSTVDVTLPSRRMPIVFRRTLGGQDVHAGPFGPGWDFNYNQRLVELRPNNFPSGSKKPIVIRSSPDRSTIGESGDVQFVTGEGHLILFKRMGREPIPEFQQDPLVQELGWNGGTQYLPAPNERGIFDLLYRHPRGEFTRLTPDGTQYWYASDGRLLRIYDRYPENQHVLEYNERGELIRIVDKSVRGDRFLEIGYYRLTGGTQGNIDLDTSSGFVNGRIAQLKDYAGRLTTFKYSVAGVLESRDGPETQSGEGGFSGRPTTLYLSKSPVFGQLQGIVAGNGAGQSGSGAGGNALFVGTQADAGDEGEKPVVTAGAGAGGAVDVDVSTDNSAASAASASHGSTTADSASTTFGFDAFGFPSLIKLAGNLLGEVEYGPVFNEHGLLERMVYPEGNSVEYKYDVDNPVFRARANLLAIRQLAGPRGGEPGEMTASYADYDLRYNIPGSHTDFDGNAHTMTLRGDARDIESIDHDGAGTTRAVRNEFGQIVEELDPSGVLRTYQYRTTDGFMERSGRGGFETGYGYNSSVAAKLGMPTTVTPPVNEAIQLGYDARLLQISLNRGGYSESSGYDENGNLVQLKRGLGGGVDYLEKRFYNQINFLNRVEIQHQGETLPTVFVPDEVFRVQRELLPGGEAREYTYDHLGNVRSMKVGSYEEAYVRDKHGNLEELRIGGDLVREYTYDGFDRPTVETRSTDPAESVVRTYYPKGELKTMVVTGAGGVVQDLVVDQIDAVGRVRQMQLKGSLASGSRSINYVQGGSGGLTVTTTGPRDTVTMVYDAAGRVGRQTSAAIGSEVFTHDDNDNLKEIRSTEDGVTYTVTRTFNALDHLLSQSDDEGAQFVQTPRLDGMPTSVTDGRSKTTGQSHSELGHLLELNRPLGIQFRYQFDKNLRPSFVGDKERGHAMEYADGTLRLTRTTLRSGDSMSFNDPDGRNLPKAVVIPGGNINRQYDRLGRVLAETVSYSGGNYRMGDAEYDALNRMRSVRYGINSLENTATFDYDPLGPLALARYEEAGKTFTVSYGLYADGTASSVTYPSGITLNLDRDNAGRLKSVGGGAGTILEITAYGGVDVPIAIQHGGVVREANSYDLRKRLKSRRYTRVSDGAVLADLRFQYDGGDNVLARQQVHRGGRTDVFEYDDASRLTTVGYGARPEIEGAENLSFTSFPVGDTSLLPGWYARMFSYDGGGLDLMTGSTLVNPAALPVLGSVGPLPDGLAVAPFAGTISGHDGYLFATQVDGVTRGRDPLGNAASAVLYVRQDGVADPVRQTATINHNGRANLVRVVREDGTLVRYHYQPSGLMHRREVELSGAVVSDTAFVWEAGRLIEEHDLIGDVLRGRYYYDDGDTPTAADIRDAGGTLRRYYYLRDQDYSIVGVVDAAGAVVERVSYEAWGQPVIEARDTQAPRVRRVVQGPGQSLLVEFSEAVAPPVSLAAGDELVTVGGSVAGAVSVDAMSAEVQWVEFAPGFAYGTVLRVTPTGAPQSSLTLRVAAGNLVDSWNNPNTDEVLTVSSGAVEGTELFVAAGVPVLGTAPKRSARSVVGNPFLFHGQWYDYETGLSYMRARWYEPTLGAFLERDPEGYEDSVFPYAGFGHNAVSFRDPSGRSIGKLVASAIGEVTTILNRTSFHKFWQAGVRHLTTKSGAAFKMADHMMDSGRLFVVVETRQGWLPMYVTSLTNRPKLAKKAAELVDEAGRELVETRFVPFYGFDDYAKGGGRGWLNKGFVQELSDMTDEMLEMSEALGKHFNLGALKLPSSAGYAERALLIRQHFQKQGVVLNKIHGDLANELLFDLGVRKVPHQININKSLEALQKEMARGEQLEFKQLFDLFLKNN